jgi:hypothetical protein
LTTFYLAARYGRRLELVGYRAQLEALGHKAPARWLDGNHQLDDRGYPIGDTGERIVERGPDASAVAAKCRVKFAADDYDDVLAADVLIAFTEEPRSTNSRGGRHVELGIALGRRMPIVVVGPRENVFCWLPAVTHFRTWAGAFEVIRRWTS